MGISSLYNLYRLRKNQWLKTCELEEIQRRKLRRIIKHAYENVKYYHELFDSVGVKPEDIKSAEELCRIPITTKSKLQSLPITEVTAKNVDLKKCFIIRTSGSLGIPLTIYLNNEDKNFQQMVVVRAKLANGQRLRDKWASIREPDREYLLQYSETPKNWFVNLGVWRKINLSCFDDIEHQLGVLEKFKPQVIVGYPSNFTLLATALQEQKHEKINPRLIFTTAELLDTHSRKFIASTFGARLFDRYGAAEFGLIAWECGKNAGYHINIDSVVVEFIWNDKTVRAGERGKLICTALHSYAMPFIRYEIGDVGVKSAKGCSCGRGLQLMKMIEGRIADFITLPNGKIASPYLVTCALEKVPGIARYQIIQEEVDRIVVLVIKKHERAGDTMMLIRKSLERVLGKDVLIDVRIVEYLLRDKAGKFRVVFSKLGKKQPLDGEA